jgi:hypothetical protein
MLGGNRFAAAVTSPYAGGTTDAARVVGRLTAIVSIAAGVIHVSAAGEHTNLPVMLVGFLAVAALQVALGAVLLWRRPSRGLILAAVALTLGSIAVWVVSRTSGLPFLEDGHMEPVGVKDAICVLFEIACLPGLLLLLSRDLPAVALPSPRLASQAVSAAAVATFALMVPALAFEGGAHHTHEEAVALGIHGHSPAHANADRASHAAGRHTRHTTDKTRHAHAARKHGERLHGTGPSHASAGRHAHTLLASSGPTHHSSGSSRHRSRHSGGDTHRAGTPHRKGAAHRRGGGHEDRPGDHGKHPGGGHSGHGDEPAGDPNICLVSLGETDVCVR